MEMTGNGNDAYNWLLNELNLRNGQKIWHRHDLKLRFPTFTQAIFLAKWMENQSGMETLHDLTAIILFVGHS